MRDDPYSFTVSVFSFFLGQQLGSLIGPYALIMLCSAAGSMVALGRRDPTKQPAGWSYIVVVMIMAFCGTWIVSVGLAKYVDWIEVDPRTLFAPVAFALGFIGLDWDEVLPSIWGLYLKLRGLPPRENKNG